jgi:hypothetical protein
MSCTVRRSGGDSAIHGLDSAQTSIPESMKQALATMTPPRAAQKKGMLLPAAFCWSSPVTDVPNASSESATSVWTAPSARTCALFSAKNCSIRGQGQKGDG